MNSVLVTGVGGPAGRASASFLSAQGIRVIGTDILDVCAAVDEFHLVPRGDDPEFVPAILDLLRFAHPFLLIPTVSEELPAIARAREMVRMLGVGLYISDPDVVDLANDKLATARMLDELGIPVPKTLYFPDGVRGNVVGRELDYPFIVKPRVGRGGRGVHLCQQDSELVGLSQSAVVYQEFMPGNEYDVNLFAYPAGSVKALAVLQKTSMKQGMVGNALTVQRVIHRDVAELGLRVASAISLEGPIDMDVRLGSDGVPRILEINARVGANVLAAPEVLETLLTNKHEGVLA